MSDLLHTSLRNSKQETALGSVYTGLEIIEWRRGAIINNGRPTMQFVECSTKFHVTYCFAPGQSTFPLGVEEDDLSKIHVLGIYADDNVLALRVKVQLLDEGERFLNSTIATNPIKYYDDEKDWLTHQVMRNGTSGKLPLHITIDVDGVSPVESGIRMGRLEDSSLTEDAMYGNNNKHFMDTVAYWYEKNNGSAVHHKLEFFDRHFSHHLYGRWKVFHK